MSGSRRSANPSAFADEASSHWRSSIATTSPSSASSCTALRTATPSARVSTGRPPASSTRSATSSARRCGAVREGRTSSSTPSKRSPRPAWVSRCSARWPRGEYSRPSLASSLDASAPECRLPDPGLALERDRDRPVCGQRPIEKRVQRPEVFVPADDVDCHGVPSTIVTGCVRKVRCAKRERCRRPARARVRLRRRRRRRAAARHGHRACSRRAFRVCRDR